MTTLELTDRDVPSQHTRTITLGGLPIAVIDRQAEAELIAAALRRTGGNASAAARQLGITRATLLYRARRHGLAVGRAFSR